MTRTVVFVALLALASRADVAVRRDGRVIKDPVMKVGGGALTWGEERPETESLKAYWLVEKDDGTLVWAAGPKSRIRGYLALARAEQAALLAALSKEAVLKARDHGLARALYDRADGLGLAPKASDALRKRVEKLEAKPKKPKPELAADVKRRAALVDALAGELLARRAALALKEDRLTGLRILRVALRQPANKTAQDLLERHADKDFKAGDSRAWLEWELHITRRGFRSATGDELELKRAKHHWRPDLYGVASGDILLISAIKDLERVGRCMAHAQLVVNALKSAFKTRNPKARTPAPLVLFLYMDRKAYKDRAGDYRRIDSPAFLEWSTVHWSERDDITRAFWPADADAERRFLYTFRRTIARHWMHGRNPQYSVSQASRSWTKPGWWLAVGFSELIAQGRYDIENGTWELFNPRGRYTDRLSSVHKQHPGLLHPWASVFFLSHKDARKIPNKFEIPTVLHWSLGPNELSSYWIYVSQAAAACRYLYHADDGKHRAALRKAVVAHYAGDTPNVNPDKAFGIGPKELGQKSVEFANLVARGWTPGDKG